MLPSLSMAPIALFLPTLSSISAGAHITNTTCPSYPTLPAKPPKPFPLSTLPKIYNPTNETQPADTIAQILHTLSLYALAIDGKDFSALSHVFTADVYTNYSAPLNILTPLTVVQMALNQSLASVDTQHLYGTQVVEVQSECQARSVSYFTATHFGRGRYFGQVLHAYGQYQDTWVKLPNDEWRIQTRNLVYMGPLIGNLSIFRP